jgi:hypothetical protein
MQALGPPLNGTYSHLRRHRADVSGRLDAARDRFNDQQKREERKKLVKKGALVGISHTIF